MTDDAKTRLIYAQAYAQALADVADLDAVLLHYRVTQLERELEIAAKAAMDLHETIRQLEAVITSASRSDSPNN